MSRLWIFIGLLFVLVLAGGSATYLLLQNQARPNQTKFIPADSLAPAQIKKTPTQINPAIKNNTYKGRFVNVVIPKKAQEFSASSDQDFEQIKWVLGKANYTIFITVATTNFSDAQDIYGKGQKTSWAGNRASIKSSSRQAVFYSVAGGVLYTLTVQGGLNPKQAAAIQAALMKPRGNK